MASSNRAALYKTTTLVFAMLVLGAQSVRDKPGHDQHDASYKSWVNRANEGCCNDQDCQPLAEVDERIIKGAIEVRIEGEWCEVKPRHYLKFGNVPDASIAHICWWRPTQRAGGPCERMLCYQPRPLT
jgi:hypothetical protein